MGTHPLVGGTLIVAAERLSLISAFALFGLATFGILTVQRWRRLRTITAGTPTVLVEGRWSASSRRGAGTSLSGRTIDAYVATRPAPKHGEFGRARLVPLDPPGRARSVPSYVLVEWL